MNHGTDGNLKDPRIITGQVDVMVQLQTGPFYYSIMKALCEQWNGTTWFKSSVGPTCIFMASGVDPTRESTSLNQRFADFANSVRNTLHSVKQGCAIAISGDDSWVAIKTSGVVYYVTFDGKRWDVHYNSDALKCEHEFFRSCAEWTNYSGQTYLDETVCDWSTVAKAHQESIRGIFTCTHFLKDGVKIAGRAPSVRRSGDGNTSVGNGVGNVMGSFRLIRSVMSRMEHDRLTSAQHDPLRLIRDSTFLNWKELGFTGDVNVTTDPSLTDFCSARLMPIDNMLYAIPKVGRFLRRSGCATP